MDNGDILDTYVRSHFKFAKVKREKASDQVSFLDIEWGDKCITIEIRSDGQIGISLLKDVVPFGNSGHDVIFSEIKNAKEFLYEILTKEE